MHCILRNICVSHVWYANVGVTANQITNGFTMSVSFDRHFLCISQEMYMWCDPGNHQHLFSCAEQKHNNEGFVSTTTSSETMIRQCFSTYHRKTH